MFCFSRSLCPLITAPILFANPSTDGDILDCRNCGVFPMESQDSMTAPALELEKGDEEPIGGDGQRYELCSEATSGWTRRSVLFLFPHHASLPRVLDLGMNLGKNLAVRPRDAFFSAAFSTSSFYGVGVLSCSAHI